MHAYLVAQQGRINAEFGLLGAANADPATNEELLEQAEAELALAQEKLNAAQAAHDNGDDALARVKLIESMDHLKRAVELIREAMEAE